MFHLRLYISDSFYYVHQLSFEYIIINMNDIPIISDFICPFTVNDQQINTLHIKACDSDPFEPNEDYLGLALWNHKIDGMTYDLGIQKIRAAQLVIKKTRNVLDLSTKSPHAILFQV